MRSFWLFPPKQVPVVICMSKRQVAKCLFRHLWPKCGYQTEGSEKQGCWDKMGYRYGRETDVGEADEARIRAAVQPLSARKKKKKKKRKPVFCIDHSCFLHFLYIQWLQITVWGQRGLQLTCVSQPWKLCCKVDKSSRCLAVNSWTFLSCHDTFKRLTAQFTNSVYLCWQT